MHANLKVLLGMVALAAGPLFAGEPGNAEAAPKRQLLQPPKMEVASPITDRFALRALFYSSDISEAVRYNNSAGVPGTLIDAEDALGFPRRLRKPGLDMVFRIGERHRIHADFYKMTRSGDQTITQQIRFGEDVYQAGERIVSNMDLRKMGIAWTWSAVRTEKLELGVGLALHLMQLQGELQSPARFERERLDAAGPFPSLAVEGSWRFTRRFSLNLSGNWLGGSFDSVEGRYQSAHADVQFRARPNFALGLGYSHTLFKVNAATTDFAGHFGLKYQGPEAFLRVSF